MAPLLLIFALIAILVVLANLGQRQQWARWLTYAIIAIFSGLTLLAGVLVLVLDVYLPTDILGPGFTANPTGTGVWLTLSGGICVVSVILAIIAFSRGEDPHLGRFYWSRPVHITALVFIVLYAGINLAFASAFTDPSILAESGVGVEIGDVLAQYVSFVALALLGVGLGIRRSWRESQTRLKVNRLGFTEIAVGWSLTLLMIFMSAMLGVITTLLSPDSTAYATAANEILIDAFSSPGGAVLLGLLSGIGEEVLYRGALQPVFGLWITSLIFALHHIQYLNLTIIIVFALGLTLGWIRNRWGTSTAALVHASYNAALILLSLVALEAVGA
ncbi:MAG: CPBP family intramembrane metalloprotease [Chloroflexi bacterium]|nr:CPBP family intramembrane metalloprotease [Chloroflexota bacterium]